MPAASDRALETFCGSRVRLLTLAVLAAADAPLTGYRVAAVAQLPRAKVYPELRKALSTGVARKTAAGFSLVDPDLRQLFRKRVRVTWDEVWDAPERRSAEAVNLELEGIRRSRSKVPLFDPNNRIPQSALRELQRDPEKDRTLVRLGFRPSARKRV